MCGIAGIIDLSGSVAPCRRGAVRAMADAIVHRGPDEDGYLERPGLALRLAPAQHRRPGRRPAADPQRGRHRRRRLQRRAVRLSRDAGASWRRRGIASAPTATPRSSRTAGKTIRSGMFDHLRGQFAIALCDDKRQRVILARDRFGICPLYWTRQTARGRLAAVRLRDQGAARLRHGRGPARSARHQSPVHLLLDARPVYLLRGRSVSAAGPFLADPTGRRGRAGAGQRADLLGDRLPDRGEEDRRDLERAGRRVRDLLLAAGHAPAAGRRAGGVVPVRRRRFQHRRGDGQQGARLARSRRSPSSIKAPRLDETTEAGIVARHIGTRADRRRLSAPRRC